MTSGGQLRGTGHVGAWPIPATVRALFAAFALSGALIAGAASVAAPAAAAGSCPSGIVATGRVDITSPRSGESVSGHVQVRGTASGVTGLSRVELQVNGSTVASQTSAPQNPLPFNLTWDASGFGTGTAHLRVVACSSGVVGSLGDGGQGDVTVNVTAPSATTTTVAAGVVVAPGTTTSLPGSTTTVRGQVKPSTSSTSTTVVAAGAPPSRGDDPQTGTPPKPPDLALPGRLARPESARSSARPPLWVGAVVGVPGVAGLALSVFRRRRNSHGSVPGPPMGVGDEAGLLDLG